MPMEIIASPRAGMDGPNAALARAAGDFAPAIARVWPKPHRAYFEADAPRRLLAGIVAARVSPDRGPALATALEGWSAKRIVAAYMPEAPAGFVEALRKLEVDRPTFKDIGLMLGVLNDRGGGAKILRHAPAITRALIHGVAALPPDLRRTRIVALLDSAQSAELLGRGALAACAGDGVKLQLLGDRLERAASCEGLFLMLIESFDLRQLRAAPIPGTDWLRPIVGVREMKRAALRFRNCLALRIPFVVNGTRAYYEAIGAEPAIVELTLNASRTRWAVGEIRGDANRDVSALLMARICDHLAVHGARGGPRHASQEGLLAQIAHAAGL